MNSRILETCRRVTSGNGRHHAFTDLIQWNGRYFLSHREARGHRSKDGRTVVVSSEDLETWREEHFPGSDLLPDYGRFLDLGSELGLYGFRTIDDPAGNLLGQAWVSRINTRGSPLPAQPLEIERNQYIWRPRRIGERYYTSTFRSRAPGEYDSELFVSSDGLRWERLSVILSGHGAIETELLGDEDGSLFAFIRRSPPPTSNLPKTLAVAVSSPPYARWEVICETDQIIHAVAACWWRGRIILIGRHLPEPAPWAQEGAPDFQQRFENHYRRVTTRIWSWSRRTGLVELLRLPSLGDCSYAGVLPERDRLLISYYSQHEQIAADPAFNAFEGGADVYLCVVRE